MSYLLIFIWITDPYDRSPQSSVVAEFNSRDACQAAAAEVKRQAFARDRRQPPLLLCAAKGEKGGAA